MEETLNYLKNRIEPNSTVVVACSGGPDSMFLLHAVNKIKDINKLKVIVAHVNHKQRIESEEEADFVKKYCLDNNDIFEYYIIENYNSKNFQQEAREKRYIFFENLVNKYQAKYLLTAHHGDDLIETVLMRIVRGSSVFGYSGFHKETKINDYYLLRPLINLTKKEIEDYMINNNYDYRVDKSNYKAKYTRNRYRKDVLTFLKKEEPNVHLKFVNYSEKLLDYYNFVQKYVDNLYNNVVKDNIISIKKLQKEDLIIQKEILAKYLKNYYSKNICSITDIHLNNILDLINNVKPNLSLDLPENKQIIKSYDNLEIDDHINPKYYQYEFDKDLVLPNGYILKTADDETDNSNFCLKLNSEEVKLPLLVRTKTNGDKMLIKNMQNYKKIKDIFIDSKIPEKERCSWPIVTDNDNNIIWIPGIKKSNFDKKCTDKYDIIIKYVKKER